MHPVRSSFAKLVVSALLIWLTAPHRARSENGEARRDDNQTKAQMICAFLKNTRWPQRKLAGDGAPLVIGIFGSDTISAQLGEMIGDIRINGRPVVITHVTEKEDLATCHLVFVSGSDPAHVSTVLKETRHENVLTVGETDDFLKRGGVIEFYKDADGRIRYDTDQGNARRERLTLGGFLLKVSKPQVQAKPPGRTGNTAAGSDDHKPDARRIAEAPHE